MTSSGLCSSWSSHQVQKTWQNIRDMIKIKIIFQESPVSTSSCLIQFTPEATSLRYTLSGMHHNHIVTVYEWTYQLLISSYYSQPLLEKGHRITTIRVSVLDVGDRTVACKSIKSSTDREKMTIIKHFLGAAFLRFFLLQFRDDDLPPLKYGPNHTLIVKTLNNSFGDLPFMTHSDEVKMSKIMGVCWHSR